MRSTSTLGSASVLSSMCQPSSPVSGSLAGVRNSRAHRLDRLEVELLAGPRIERRAPPASRADPRHRRRSAGAAGRVRRRPRDRDCRAAPSSPGRGGRARRAARPGTPRGCARTGRPARSGAAAPSAFDGLEADAHRLGHRGGFEAAVARFIETFGELQRDPALLGRRTSVRSARAHGPPATAAVRRRNPAHRGHPRAGRPCGRPSPPRSAFARPALVGFGQGRRHSGQRLGGIGRRIEHGRFALGDRAVIGPILPTAADSFRVPAG